MSHWEQPKGLSDEWITPAHVFDALGVHFDLDVASPIYYRDIYVPCARRFICGALEKQWFGFVWMNPPFGNRNGLQPWLRRFFDHGNGIALTPDRTSAPWFREAWSKADFVMFTPKLKFLRPDGTVGKGPSNGTALFASGDRAVDALKRANKKGLGVLGLPIGEAA